MVLTAPHMGSEGFAGFGFGHDLGFKALAQSSTSRVLTTGPCSLIILRTSKLQFGFMRFI